jgi:hypothetical protein
LLLPLFKIIIGKQKVHRKVSVITMKVVKFIKTYCQNMECDALELCLIAAKIEGLKSLLPKYGMGVLELCFNCNKKLYGILSQYRYVFKITELRAILQR